MSYSSSTASASSKTSPPAEMIHIAGGTFAMGETRFYPEEGPVRDVTVDDFFIDAVPVTNRQFSRFVDDTGYMTTAEVPPDPAAYPGADPAMLVAGSLVFKAPRNAGEMRFWGDWWHYVPDACWHRPDGTTALTDAQLDHPVVHVSFNDASAFADWAGKRLPTEAEWEFAARGGLPGAAYSWGEEFEPDGQVMANTWNGHFPMADIGGKQVGTSPVKSYPENGYGLFDMIGNVWEWTADYWAERHPSAPSCCKPSAPQRSAAEASFDPMQPNIKIARKVLKGGSHLCAPSYCRRYRPAARQPEMVDSATSHLGFRCVAHTDRRSQ
jgi:formylglycine-generating enzyme required for sulfatase activity